MFRFVALLLPPVAALLYLAAHPLLRADDVGWLSKVQTAPTEIPREQIGTLAPLLVDRDGQAITTREAWERQRQQVRDKWLAFLGPMPDPRPPVRLEVLTSELVGQVRRELVRYEGEPGVFVEGYLLRRIDVGDEQKRPGIVALHQTTRATIDEIAGVSGPPDVQIGLKLAQSGFVVFCPRCFLWQDAADYNEAVVRHRERHPQSLGMAKMLYDDSSICASGSRRTCNNQACLPGQRRQDSRGVSRCHEVCCCCS
jgi:hypothetical protein